MVVFIAFHYEKDRVHYLEHIIEIFVTDYSQLLDTSVFVDTNDQKTLESSVVQGLATSVFVHPALESPHYLPWQHRRWMWKNRYYYDYFMYTEADMEVPFDGFVNYINVFDGLWEAGLSPGFTRIESVNGSYYNTDAVMSEEKEYFYNQTLTKVGGRVYATLKNPYHAFWILPQRIILGMEQDAFLSQETPQDTSTKVMAASLPQKRFSKTTVVELTKSPAGYVSPVCWSYHLPNNYAITGGGKYGSKYGKVSMEDVRIEPNDVIKLLN